MLSSISILALFAGAVVALTEPTVQGTGNPVRAPLTEIVPACKPYTIKWDPTTKGTLSIILLRGPGENIKRHSIIVEGIENKGTYVWTPAATLEADTTHYGLQLVDDATGVFQYSNQFGISKDSCDAVSSSASMSMSGYPTASVKSVSSAYSTMVPSSSANSTTVYTPSSSYIAPTGYPVANSSIILPSKSMSVPVSLKTSASGSPVAPTSASASPTSPLSTGAASSLRAGLGLAGAVAGMVFML